MMYLVIFLAILVAVVIICLVKSFYIPKPLHIKAIMLFGKPFAYIGNIEGKTVNMDTGKIEDGENERWNIYFFLYPFCRPYSRPFRYTKFKRLGEQLPTDIIIWKDEKSKECIVSRTGISDHLLYKVEYPNMNPNLELKEMGRVNILINNLHEIKDASKAFFSVDNPLGVVNDTLSSHLRGLIATKKINELNALSSEQKQAFNDSMIECNQCIGNHPGLEDYGYNLSQSIFKGFEPADKETENLMNSNLQIEVTKNEAVVAKEKQQGLTDAYNIKMDSEIEKEKKRRIEIGVAKVDTNGKITELVPEADTAVIAENIGKLKDMQGTLVLGGENANLLNIGKK